MAVSPSALPHRRLPSRVLLAVVAVLAALAGIVALLLATEVFDRSSDALVGSGVAATDERDVDPFRGIELAGGTELTIQLGAPRSVLVSADDNLLDRVTTRVDGEELVVGTEGSFTTTSPMAVRVTIPSLDSLELSGSGAVVADGIRGSALSVVLSGSGLVRASGRVRVLDVTLSGSGNVELGELATTDARAELGGSGRIVVRPTGTLEATIPGSGTITYLGDPLRVEQSVTGSGAVVGG